MAKNTEPNNEISVSKDGVTLKGDVVDDVRQPIRRAAGTVDNVLRLLDNVVGLPADFVNSHLERFREKYREEVREIPEEHFQTPNSRVGYSVLRHVAYAAEEEEIQELFAKLLATASDNRTAKNAHPSFASVINDLLPHEAKVLMCIFRGGRLNIHGAGSLESLRELSEVHNIETVLVAVSNLMRLGLVELDVTERAPKDYTLRRIEGDRYYGNVRDLSDVARVLERGLNDLVRVKGAVISALQEHRIERNIRVSDYGRQFIRACLPTDNEAKSNEDQ